MHAQVGGSSQAGDMCDELNEWLAQPLVPTEDWWIVNQKLYPHLSRMAIDVHAMPGKLMHILETFRVLICHV